MHRLASSLVALCLALPAAAQSVPDFQNEAFVTPYWTRVPVIEVLGRANMEVAPNRASFSVTYLETDKDSKKAMQLAVERGRLAYDTIKKTAGESARIQSSVNVTALYEQYKDKDGNRIDNERSDKIRAYEARVSLSIVVDQVSKAGAARAGALALAPENSTGLSTYLERTTDMNRAAYEAAVEDGTARAKATAEASGAVIGKLMVVQEGTGPCLGQWSSMAGSDYDYYRSAPAAMAPPSPPPPPAPVAAGMVGGRQITITQADIDTLNLPSDDKPQQISASVCMIYALGK
ncbi:SIMPL domain-containing protein [Hyphomonas sp. WL0036]|uniref:SIMPL domain-containing protein n=1 Tax=Hyphomonas sediminis TaxID=2866160 RepID=UPI001C812D0B|nr:SIMPL domain-containing protein [Hyphomonas sediminis]MBY9066481.1 SIMPL domain-containing protein [Hyphomonas sediminis]